jgi:Ser/Thr protein kinase RdoA (MazF antagonist)
MTEERRVLHKSLSVIGALAPYGRRHWRWFALGSLAAIAVVAGRLALPWPLRAVADRWISKGPSADGMVGLLPSSMDPVLAMGSVFFVLILALGLADFLERLCFARFSVATVRDLRTEAFSSALGARTKEDDTPTGDLVSRLVGDAARVKSGIQAFLVRVATNGLVFFGMTIILLKMQAQLGLIFAAAGLGTALVTLWAAARIFQSSLEHRDKEGELANEIQAALETQSGEATLLAIKGDSGRDETTPTRFQGIATWTTHGIFGAAVLAALWVGALAVEAGEMQGGDMVVFMMYALMMRGPIVRLARQGARTGKILGAAYRLVQLSMTAPAMNANITVAAKGTSPAQDSPLVPPLGDRVYRNHLALHDPQALASRLTHAWAQARWKRWKVPRVAAVHLRQTNYKPFERARLVAEIVFDPAHPTEGQGQQFVFISVYATAECAREHYVQSVQKPPLESCGPPVSLIEDWYAVAWLLPNEPHLDSLLFCFDQGLFTQFLADHRLIPAMPGRPLRLPQLMRYVPMHRALFRHVPKCPAEPTLYLKVFEPGKDGKAARNLAMLTEAAARGGLGFQPPRLLVYSPRLRAVAMSEVRGTRLTELLSTATPSVFSAVGRALAGLHASDLKPSDTWTAQWEIKALYRAMDGVKKALPAVTPALSLLLKQIVALQERLQFIERTPIHANLFGDQILCDSDRIGIVDWDDLAWGDPLYDVGRLIAHLIFVVHRTKTPPARLVGLIDVLLNAYVTETKRLLDAERLRWHIAVALLLRAKISALRLLTATWIEDIRWSLSEADLILNEKSQWTPK